MNDSTPPPSDELCWQAARYLLDELPPAEAEQFEALLAVDQAACDALAAEAALLDGLGRLNAADFAAASSFVPPPVVPRAVEKRSPAAAGELGSRKMTSRGVWAASGMLAAGLLLTASLVSLAPWPGASTDAPSWARGEFDPAEARLGGRSKLERVDRLVLLWSENRDFYESLAELDAPTADDGEFSELTIQSYLPRTGSVAESDDAAIAPDWMLAAVEAESAEPEPGEGDQRENAPWQ